MPGELTVVTGVPNSGKSEWIDALLCNLNGSEGWRFALCSMENKVSLLMIKFKYAMVFLIATSYASLCAVCVPSWQY